MNQGLTAVPGIRVGHASDPGAGTGCTVVIGPFRAATDIRGMATGSREVEAISPLHVAPLANAILLTGGSAFGLDAAQGVVQWLEERGAGYDTGVAKVPIVPAAVIFDLGVASPGRRPDAAMGRAAAEEASTGPVAEGRVGVGTGATVGKLRGPAGAMPGGLGSWAIVGPHYTVGALVVVNAVGDIIDGEGRILAGTRDESGELLDTTRVLLEGRLPGGPGPMPGGNTTLAVIATDAPLTRVALQAVARMASTGVARRITPVHTPFDGDMTFAVSTSAESMELDREIVLRIGVLAAHALEVAIERAVTIIPTSVEL